MKITRKQLIRLIEQARHIEESNGTDSKEYEGSHTMQRIVIDDAAKLERIYTMVGEIEKQTGEILRLWKAWQATQTAD